MANRALIFIFSLLKMTAENMKNSNTINMDFWQQLAPAYQYVEEYKKIPSISVKTVAIW